MRTSVLGRLAVLALVCLVCLAAPVAHASDTAPPGAALVVPDVPDVGGAYTVTDTAMRAEWNGLGEFTRFIDESARRFENPAPLMHRVAEHGRSSTVERIEAGDFTPNAPATADAKGSNKPLQDSGRYTQSITVAWGDDFAAWGSNAIQAAMLQRGGTIEPKTAKFLAFPGSRRAQRFVNRYGSNRAAVDGLRESGYNVWTVVRPDGSGGAVLAKRKTASNRSKPFVLLVLKSEITVPARPHYLLDAHDEAEISRMATRWLAGELR